MAAPCREMLKTVALRGLCQMTSRVPCMHRYAALEAFSLGSYQKFPPNRQVHCSHGAKLMSAQTEPHKTTEESEEQPEYIPKRKAKNPMMKIGFAWIIGLPSGVIAFILAKREVDKNRLKQLKIRQRMKKANEGDYESDRYKVAEKPQ